jgi:pimeloyl-ACP methyl ester carboxylesterase
MARTFPKWIGRVAVAVGALLVVAWIVLGWLHANAIRSEFLIPRPHLEGYPLDVVSNDAGRVVITRTAQSQREGVWGLEAEDAYAQVSTIVSIAPDVVERGVRTLEGELEAGDVARIDPDAFTGDPLSAHRIGFENVVIPSDIGPHTGWFIDGRRSTWVVFVHGEGNDRLPEALRVIPSLVEQGYPVMVISYRNDVGATPSPSGMRLWGLDEWRDVDAAIELALRKGAKDFVLYGSGYGASVASMFLHESDQIGVVRGAIYESPVVDLESVVTRWSRESGTPRVVGWLGRRLATIRFGVEWGMLDQVERADEFDVPLLVLVGGEDPVSYPDDIEAFADAVGPLARSSRVEQAGQADLWNIDQERYERTIRDWLLELLGPE